MSSITRFPPGLGTAGFYYCLLGRAISVPWGASWCKTSLSITTNAAPPELSFPGSQVSLGGLMNVTVPVVSWLMILMGLSQEAEVCR